MDNDFVEKYINLVRKIAHSFKNTGTDYDDLIQEGLLGLYEAHKNFDVSRGVTFITYATHCIKNKILAFLKQERKHLTGPISDRQFGDPISEQQDTQNTLNLPDDIPYLEKQILILYFVDKKTLNEIAKILEISREKARQLKNKAMRRYKSKLTP